MRKYNMPAPEWMGWAQGVVLGLGSFLILRHLCETFGRDPSELALLGTCVMVGLLPQLRGN